MAKPNAHTASREELRGAGVRADLVDEILKQRRRKDGPTLEALGEVPGVGPATLEQLGQALDFTPPPDQGGVAKGEPSPPQRERPAGDEAKAEARAEAARHAAEAGTRAADLGARAGLRMLGQTTEAAAEAAGGAQRQAAQGAAQAAPDTAAFGQAFLGLLQEQGRENLQAMAALARAQGLGEVLEIQGGYLRGTLERMTELNRRWLALAAGAGAGAAWPGGPPLGGEGRGGGGRGERAAR